MSQYVNLNPFVWAAVFLLVVAIVATHPRWKARRRRRVWLEARRARRAEDVAWRRRESEAVLARSLGAGLYDQAQEAGGHSVRHAYDGGGE